MPKVSGHINMYRINIRGLKPILERFNRIIEEGLFMNIYNTSRTASRVGIPDLGLRLEPGDFVTIAGNQLSPDLQKALNAGLVAIKYTENEQNIKNDINKTNKIITKAIRESSHTNSNTKIVLPILDLGNVGNVRMAIFVKE